MKIDLTSGRWINKPERYQVGCDSVEIITEPETDFWQRSYYGFRNDNAPALLFDSTQNFTFTARAAFDYENQFDQCGLVMYIDSENWFKASIEHENEAYSRLGSVVTNRGYSDWATNDIETPTSIWYRLSRRGPDFLIESSFNDHDFVQMRIFHLHSLGETTVEMGRKNPPEAAKKTVGFGLYACSPSNSSFKAVFTDFNIEDCVWKAHGSSGYQA